MITGIVVAEENRETIVEVRFIYYQTIALISLEVPGVLGIRTTSRGETTKEETRART